MKRILNFLSLLSILALSSCANDLNDKKREEMSAQPPRYEVPYDQIPQATQTRYETDYRYTTISDTRNEEPKPIQIYPENYRTETNTLPMAKPQEGIPAPGKPGFVISPYSPQAGLVDIQGFPPGSEVRDPYSGKTMLVPFTRDKSQKTSINKKENESVTGSPILAPMEIEKKPTKKPGQTLPITETPVTGSPITESPVTGPPAAGAPSPRPTVEMGPPIITR